MNNVNEDWEAPRWIGCLVRQGVKEVLDELAEQKDKYENTNDVIREAIYEFIGLNTCEWKYVDIVMHHKVDSEYVVSCREENIVISLQKDELSRCPSCERKINIKGQSND